MTRPQDVAREASARAVVPPLLIALVIKTNQGGLWTTPHVDELLSRGHGVVAVLPAGDGLLRRALVHRGVRVVDSAADFRFHPTWRTLRGLAALRGQLRDLAPDVVHYHLYASALAVRLATWRLGVPRVHMVAGPLYLESPVIRAAERLLARLDTVTIGGSEFTARLYRSLGRPASRTPAIPYGVDTDRFRPLDPVVREHMRARLGIAPEDFVVIMVAHVYAPRRAVHAGRGIKGHDVLLDAWQRFRDVHPGARLLLVGGGFDERGEAHRQDLIARFRLDRADSDVIWVRTTTDVRPYYAAADLSVSPSLSDNHGAALEAGAMGLPSVVSDVGALPEAVEPGSCWVVPPDDPDALAAALEKARGEHARGRLGARGADARARVVRRFDSAVSAAAVADVLERAARPRAEKPFRGRVISLFVETRFGRDADGRWAAGDAASGPQAWFAYTAQGDRVRLVARADREPGTAACAIDGAVDLRPLTNYQGVVGLLRALPRLVFAVGQEVLRAEVVVLRLPGAVGSLAGLACRILRRRYGVEVVGDPFDVLAAGTLGAGGRRVARLAAAQMAWTVRGAAAARYVTRSTLQQRYPPAPSAPTAGVSNVVIRHDSLLGQPRTWSPAPYRVLAVGSQEQRYKGHDVLLRAVHRLIGEGLDIRCVLVGGGRHHDELVALARTLGIAERVTFTGAVHDRGRIVELLDSAQLFAMPSRTEGLPRALIEAMARALPAVGSRIGGIPELLDERCLVDVEDDAALARVMRALLTDPDAWERQSARNLDVARTYEDVLLDAEHTTWLAQVPTARRRARPGTRGEVTDEQARA